MDNNNCAIANQTWECYKTVSNNLELLKDQISDIVHEYVLGSSMILDECIKLFIKQENRYMVASCSVQEKLNPSKDAYPEECWVHFCAEKQASNYTVYVVDLKKTNSGAITKEQVERIFLDKFSSRAVSFVWLIDHTPNESLSSGLGNLKASIFSSGESIVVAPNDSSLRNCFLYDKLIIEHGLNRKVRAKGTLVKILDALDRILAYDNTYCPSEEELVNLTGILVSKNFSPQKPNEKDLQDGVIKMLCKIEGHAKIIEKCIENIHNYFCGNKRKYSEIMPKYEMQLLNNGITPEVKDCLSLVVRDRLDFLMASIQLIPRKEIAYEMLNDLVCYLVDNKVKYFMLEEQELEEKVRSVQSKLRGVSENETISKFNELSVMQQRLNEVRKQLDYHLNKAKIVENLDLNELLLLLGEQSKYPCNCVHMLKQQTVNMLIENARREISEGTSLALIRIIASLPKEMKMTLSVKHFLFPVPEEDVQWIIKLGLDQKLVTEDIDVLCEIIYEVLLNSENPSNQSQAVSVLEMYKEQLSEKFAELLELQRNYTSTGNLKYIERGKPIPRNYFCRLLPFNEMNIELLEQLTESNTQDIPELIIRELKSCISESSDPGIVFRSFKLLLKLQLLSWSDPEIRVLLRNPVHTENILTHILKSCIITEIPEILLKEIKILPKTNLVEFFLNAVQMKSIVNNITSKLTNPKTSNEEKKKIIKSITDIKFFDSKIIIELLENRIKCDDNLKAEAFQALIKIVPNEYDINKILQYLDIKSFIDQDMAALKAKHCNLIPLLNEIIKYLYSTKKTDHVELSSLLEMTFISELSFKQFCLLLNFAKYSNNKEVRNRIKRFIQGSNYGQEEIVDIIQYLEFLEEFCLQSYPELNLRTLQHCVEDGYGITEEVLYMLTNALQSKVDLKQKLWIENILFNIGQHQNIPSGVWLSLLEVIKAPNDSHLSPEFIAFVANTCQAQLSGRALNSMFKYENSFIALCGFANYAKERTVSSSDLHMVGQLLINLNENIETRTLAAAILACQEEKGVYLPQFITVKLQQEFFSDLLCSKISEEYQILRDFLNDDDQTFHEKFYALRGISCNQVENAAILWKCCINYCLSEISEEYKVLLDFLQDDFKSFHEKFYVLHALSSSEAVNKAILSNFCMNDWRKELFSYSFFVEMIQIKEDANEFKLMEFRDNINKLHQFLEKDKTHSSEAVYEAMLRKQRTFAFGMRDGINVLIMLQSNPDAIHLLINSSDTFVQKLRYSWLSYNLQMKKIEHTSTQLHELNKYLVFKTTAMEHFLLKLEGKSSIQQLTEFLQMLTESDLPLDSKEKFLMDGTDLLSANQWKSKLAQFLVKKMLKKKLQKFKDHKIKSKLNLMKTFCIWATNNPTEQDANRIKKQHEKFLAYLLLSGWSESSLFQLLDNLVTKDEFAAFLWIPIIIYDYQLSICTKNNEKKTLQYIFKKYPANCWEEKTHKMALYNSFKGTGTKTLTDLMKEVYELNEFTELEYLNEQKLQSDFKAVMGKYNSCPALSASHHKINFWGEDEIKFWAVKVRQVPDNADLFEKIAVIKRAVEVSCRFQLRDIQLITVLILLQANSKTGCLAQVNTGEGKTIIIAMIAAIHSLKGCTVDVVTSSPELARPQSQEMQHFFSLMKLTVDHNTKKNEKTCYKADIVYGAASNFQGDILRDEYNQLGICCRRSCDIAIVDEVDSMLIDNRNYKVMLSSPMPGMNHLEPILAAIWVQIDAVISVLVEKNGVLFYKKNPDELLQIEIAKEEFIKICVREHVRKLIRVEKLSSEEEKYTELKIPKHLLKLVNEVQIHKWIDCALYAKYGCEHDRHYIIKDNKIIPVDASNTGVVQQNMHWNDGLHQFLQIKHGLRITPENLCTNFISNVAYFQRYNKIYGLTGTLGSTNAINLLKKVYNVSNVYLPPFKKAQHLELEPIIVMNEREHQETIVVNSLSKLKNGRAVLIIAKYIAEAKKLHNMFIHDYDYKEHKVKTYQTENDTSIIKESLKPGEVIIATNIAGRGTDIKLDCEIEQHGGLHVCVTFLPSNLRTEKQNVGRTSRKGHKGTSQFIILGKHKSITEIRKERDVQEEIALKNAENEIKIVCMHDEVFKRFCELLKVVQKKDDANNDIKMKALEERFALWFQLQHKFFENGEVKSIMQSFEFFRNKVEKEARDGKLIENPYFYVQIGNRFLEDDKYDEAIKNYTEAINMDPDFGENAYFNRGYAYIAKSSHDAVNYEKELYNAVEDFRKAKGIIERCEQYLHIMQLTHSEVTEQVSLKRKIYAIQKSAIDKAIGIGNEIRDKSDFLSEPEKKQNCHKGIIFQAIEKKWNLKITRQKLQQIFKDSENITLYEKNIALSEAEIKESENNGCIGSFELKMMRPPINWLALIGVSISGIMHIVCGILLFCLDAPALGIDLCLEGIKDFICVIENIVKKRNFDWKRWGIRKAMSTVISIVVFGFSTIKNISKSFMSELKAAVSIGGNYVVANAKKNLQKQVEAYTGQLNELTRGLTECGINRSIMTTLQDAISVSIAGRLEDVLNKLLSDECQEEFIRKVLEGLIGDEKIEKYAINIAAEIKHKKVHYSGLNDIASKDIKDLKYTSHFINYFISVFKAEVNSMQRSLETQDHMETNYTPDKCKQFSEEIADQVSTCVTNLVERQIVRAYFTEGFKINREEAKVLMKENDEHAMQYNTEVLGNKLNECLQKSTVQEMLLCLSDVAQIPIRLVDEKRKWLHTIGKDKVGTAIKLKFTSGIEESVNNSWLFSEAAKLSGMPVNELKYLVVKHLSIQDERKLNESVLLKLYKEELQRIPKIEETPSKLSYLCMEQYNQIAYRAFAELSETVDEGCLKKVTISAKKFHWHPNFMLCFKHTTSSAKKITEASGHKVVLKNPIKCREKTCVLNIYPYEGVKSNLGSF